MQEGEIIKWQDDRGFGFIETRDGAELFFHISNWQGSGRPAEGLRVRFVSGRDAKGREEAQQVVPLSGRILPGNRDWQDSSRFRDSGENDDYEGSSRASDWGFKILVFAAAFAAAFFFWDKIQTGWVNATNGSQTAGQSAQELRQAARRYPDEVYQTLRLIHQGGPFAHRQDGSVFQNRERQLPARPRGYYREYTVRTPGARDRGARRIVTGGDPPTDYYYTDNHYRSFERMELDRD